MSTLALGCLCGKRMLEAANEGTCLWCGHGRARAVIEYAYALNMRKVAPALDARAVAISTSARWEWSQDACARAALEEEARTGSFPSCRSWQRAKERNEHRPSYGTIAARFGSWEAFRRYCAEIPREAIAA